MMPTAPTLSPEAMAQAGAGAPTNPMNFLVAAADMHNSGSLSMPSGPSEDPLASAKSKRPFGKKIRMVK